MPICYYISEWELISDELTGHHFKCIAMIFLNVHYFKFINAEVYKSIPVGTGG